MRIGVYICRVSAETDGGANLESVGHYVANLPQVEVVRSLGLLPRLDPGGARRRDRRGRARQGRDRRRLAGILQAGLHAGDVAGGARARRSAARVVPRARGERRRRDGARQGDRRLRRLRRPVHARRATERREVDVGHARDRGRHRRHPGGARDRRRRQEGLPGRAQRHHRRPHGDVRQDLPHPRLRRLHPDAQDGRRRAAPDDRDAHLLRGRVHQRRARLVPGHRAASRATRGRGRLRGLQHLQRGVPGPGPERVRRRNRRAQGDLHPVPPGSAQRVPRRRGVVHLRADQRAEVRRLRQEVPQGVHRPRRPRRRSCSSTSAA